MFFDSAYKVNENELEKIQLVCYINKKRIRKNRDVIPSIYNNDRLLFVEND